MDKKSRELVMAKLYLKNKDYKMAEKSFNEYLSMNPEDVAALKLLAQVHEHNKHFDKAFEMYERCYLAEPDRTGVLLDICRILLMNEIWLEHVDYRKWLNLAIKAFPNNPIVVNFKSFLSTLPPEERSSPPREVQNKLVSRNRADDPLAKILEKLSLMETRLEKIENKISNLNTQTINSNQPVTVPSAFTESTVTSSWGPTTSIFGIKTTTSSFDTKTTASTFDTKTTASSSDTKTTASSYDPKTTTSIFGSKITSSIFDAGIVNPPEPTSQSSNTFGIFPPKSSPPKSTFTPSTNQNAPSLFGIPTNLSAEGSKNATPPSLFQFGQVSNLSASNTSMSSPFSQSNNLFADSMKKLNIPTVGTWATKSPNSSFSLSQATKPQETENNDDAENEADNGVVPNEELAIENTCDMTPIEIKTGEEDEDLVFEHRCKLFRLRDKEYKERGLGSIKVLKHKTTGKGRLIMRREAIGLVCLNCWDCRSIERVRDNQVRWIGLDASDGEPELTVFLVKFKTSDLTDTFMSHLTKVFSEVQGDTSISSPQTKSSENKSNPVSGASDKPEIELVDPELDPQLVDKARKLQLPDLFYHKLKNQDSCAGCKGCENDD